MTALKILYRRLLLHTWWLLVASLVIVLLILSPTVYAKWSTSSERYDANKVNLKDVPYRPVALVFGAGLYDGNKPTLYLANRVKTAVDLYKAGRVGRLLMTGDNDRTSYDEPTAMKLYAEKLGMNPSKITLDYAGFDTYDSCYRAKAIFQLSSITIVTQGYHLPRAMMTCKGLGVNSIGVAAEHQSQRDWQFAYIVREWGSTDKAVIQLLLKPKPAILGRPEPVTDN